MAEVGDGPICLNAASPLGSRGRALPPGAGEPKKKPPRVDREEALTKK